MKWYIPIILLVLMIPIVTALPYTLYNPSSSTVYNPNVTFNFSVDSSGYVLRTCSLWINSTLNQTNTSTIASATPYQMNAVFSSSAVYPWNVGCTYHSVCTQNLANVSTGCGDLDTGAYWSNATAQNPTKGQNAYDGNDVTYSYNPTTDTYVYVFVNYSKPSAADSAITRALISGANPGIVGPSCYNGTTWLDIGNYSGSTSSFVVNSGCMLDPVQLKFPIFMNSLGDGISRIYEIYMDWNIVGMDNSSTSNLTLDLTTPPTIGMYPLTYNSANLTNQFLCNASSVRSLSNITYYIWNSTNDIVNTTYFNVTGTFNQTSTYLSVNTSGSYTWGCVAYDYLGNYNATNSTIVISTTSPSVNIPAGPSYTYLAAPVVTLIAVSPGEATTNCTLYINGTPSGNNATIPSGVTTTITSTTNLTEGTWSIYVNCSNSLGATGASTLEMIYVDLTPPNVTWYALNSATGTAPYIGYIYSNCTDNFGVSNVDTFWFDYDTGTVSSLYAMTLNANGTWQKVYPYPSPVYPATNLYVNYSFRCYDLAGNSFSYLNSNLSLLISATAPVTPAGGGGGSDIAAIIGTIANTTGVCGDGYCDASENVQTCWQDCRANLDRTVSCLVNRDCGSNLNWFLVAIVVFLIGIIIYVFIYTEVIKR